MSLNKVSITKKIIIISTIFLLIFNILAISFLSDIKMNNKIPPHLEIGDLLFCDVDQKKFELAKSFGFNLYFLDIIPGESNDHVAMYIGNGTFIENCPYYYNSNDKRWYGVVTSSFELIDLWASNLKYGYVKNVSSSVKKEAADWSFNLLNMPYGIAGNKCRNLIMDAYDSQDVDIHISLRDRYGEDVELYKNKDDNDFWYPGYFLKIFNILYYDIASDKQRL